MSSEYENSIEIDGRREVFVVVFPPDGEHIISGGYEQKIRRWRVKDGKEVGTAMCAGDGVYGLAVSQDGKWIVSGTGDGRVVVWDADSHEKVRGWKAHGDLVCAVDVSADGTKIASGSGDRTACVWSISTGKRLFQWKHNNWVIAVRFSPNQRLVATVAWDDSVRVYDSKNGRLLFDIPIRVSSLYNRSLVWSGDNQQFFALSHDGNIYHIDAFTGRTLSQWPIHNDKPQCMSLVSNSTLIASSADESVSFWDIATRARVGEVIKHSGVISSMAISKNLDLVTTVNKRIFVRSLRNALPSRYWNNGHSNPEEATLPSDVREETPDLVKQLRNQVSDLQRALNLKTDELDATSKQLSDSQRALHLKEKELEESLGTIYQLRTKLTGSNDLVRIHEKMYECEILYGRDCTADAANILRKITDTANEEVRANIFIMNRLADFTRRFVGKLESLGDAAVDSKNHDAAIKNYSDALSFGPVNFSEILVKRSKVRALMNSWEGALADANKAIELDPGSPYGYESKRAALLGARRFDEAIHAYNDMLTRLDESPDPVIRESRKTYVSPSETTKIIRDFVKQSQRDLPLVLINTETGLLRDLNGRTTDFEADVIFKELVASTMNLERDRIDHVVQEYFQYATFSHTWDGSELSFQDVQNKSVHELGKSPKFAKLAMFCRMALDAKIRWAWSDTCCINKLDGPVLQESLTSMYKWYHNSALTIVHLMGVPSDRKHLRALTGCLWNTRAWTLQEFFASKVVRFYTEDWQIYLPDEITYNHKESVVIMAEMAAATGVDAQDLLSLCPGSKDVRQKLCLAATRIATKQEDTAYSLFGIFDVSLSVTYGEGQQRALGRLLSEVLNVSGDATILAWTGRASEYNSCLPAEITVYRELRSPYTPSLIKDDIMEQLVARLRTSSESAVMLYDRVISLRSPRFSGRLLALPCMMFPLQRVSARKGEHLRVYHAAVGGLGSVEIKTTEDLSTFPNLFVAHPWLWDLADPAPLNENFMFNIAAGPPLDENDGHENATTSTTPVLFSSHQPCFDKRTRALRLFARLRQPFGGLLLAPLSNREFKRVASDHFITAQLLQDITPDQLVPLIHTIDVV